MDAVSDLSARRALISSGVVALTAELAMRFGNFNTGSALAGGVAVALVVDYLSTQQETKTEVRSAMEAMTEWFGGSTMESKQGWELRQILGGVVALLGLFGGQLIINRLSTVPVPVSRALVPFQGPGPLVPLAQAGRLAMPTVHALYERIFERLGDRFVGDDRAALDAALRDGLAEVVREFDNGRLLIEYKTGQVAVVQRDGVRTAIFWDSIQQQTEGVPILNFDNDFEEKAAEVGRRFLPRQNREPEEDFDESSTDSSYSVPAEIKKKELERQRQVRINNLDALITSSFNSMMTFPADSRSSWMVKLEELDKEYMDLMGDGSMSLLKVLQEAYEEDNAGKNDD